MSAERREVPLQKVLDLALGTPDVGCANLNMLYTLLRHMLLLMKIADAPVPLETPPTQPEMSTSLQTEAATVATEAPSNQALQAQVAKLQNDVSKLLDFPTASALIDEASASAADAALTAAAAAPSTPAEMWQRMQLRKQTEANREGVDKLMEMMTDVIKRIAGLEAEMKRGEREGELEEMKAQLPELRSKVNSLETSLSDLQRSVDSREGLVSWSQLETEMLRFDRDREALETRVESLRRVQSALRKRIQSSADKDESGISDSASAEIEAPKPTTTITTTSGGEMQLQANGTREMETREQSRVIGEIRGNLQGTIADEANLERFVNAESRQGVVGTSHSNRGAEMTPVAPSTTPGAPSQQAHPTPIGVGMELTPTIEAGAEVIGEITGEIRGLITRSRDASRNQNIDSSMSDSGAATSAAASSAAAGTAPDDATIDGVAPPEILMNAKIHGQIFSGVLGVVSDRRPASPEIAPRIPPEGESQIGRPASDVKAALVRSPPTAPSPALSNTLNKLGGISGLHEQLEAKVASLEDKLNALVRFQNSLPENLSETLSQLESMIEDGGGVNENVQGTLAGLHQDLVALTATLESTQSEGRAQQRSIDELFRASGRLQDDKTDRSWVISELDNKSDKTMVDAKISRHTFDKSVDDLQKSISDLYSKLCGHEEALKEALDVINKEMDSKVDRMELEPLREYIESRLKSFQKKLLRVGDAFGGGDDADAAGIRKQLIQRFHCISCDNPVKVAPQAPIPSLPQGDGLPPNRSPRPYTTYELEQIRQHQKQMQSGDYLEGVGQARPCGGTHTVTFPHKRITKVSPATPFIDERPEMAVSEPAPVSSGIKNELDIQGVDGHIYKGRVDVSRFPPVANGAGPKMAARPSSSRGTNRIGGVVGAGSQPNGITRPESVAGVVAKQE